MVTKVKANLQVTMLL